MANTWLLSGPETHAVTPLAGRGLDAEGPLSDLLTTADLGAENLIALLDLAAQFKESPHRFNDLLRGDTVVLYFNKPSTRTRISFETAVTRLGGTPLRSGRTSCSWTAARPSRTRLA